MAQEEKLQVELRTKPSSPDILSVLFGFLYIVAALLIILFLWLFGGSISLL